MRYLLAVRYLVVAVSLFAACSWLQAQTEPRPAFRETAVVPLFRAINPDIAYFQTFLKKPLDDRHTLLLVRGDTYIPREIGEDLEWRHIWWGKDTLLGLFLMDNADPNQVWELAYIPGDGEIHGEVDRADSSSLVLRLQAGDYGFTAEWMKLFFDVGAKRLLQQVRYWPVAVEKIVMRFWRSAFMPDRPRLYFVGNSRDELVVAAWDWDRREATLVTGAEEQEVLDNMARIGQRDIARVKPYRHDWTYRSDWSDWDDHRITLVPIDFSKRFFVSFRNSGLQSVAEGVAERTQEGYQLYPFPQSSWQDFLRARMEHARSAFGNRATIERTIEEKIGPYQIVGDRFWFGKTFYDGEGMEGVGGVGYFDPESKQYVIHSPPELVDWSASALLVEDDAVWVGLVGHPEGADYSGGLLRFEPATGKAEKYDVKEIILTIEQGHDALFLGTTDGLHVLQDGRMQRFVFEPALDGKLQVYSEPVASKSP